MDVDAVRAAAADCRRRVAVQPEQPDRPARARRRDRAPARRHRRRRRRRRVATPAIVVLDEAYAEFVDRSLLGPARPLPEPHRRPHREQGLRAGRAAGRVRHRPAATSSPDSNPYRPPGSVSTVSVTIVTEALRGPEARRPPTSSGSTRERERLRDGLAAAGWSVGPSVTNFLLVDFGSVERAAAVAEGLLQRGLVPRTFPAGHPLADHLRLTVRDGRRERPAARRGARARDRAMTTPLGTLDVRERDGPTGHRRIGRPARRTSRSRLDLDGARRRPRSRPASASTTTC